MKQPMKLVMNAVGYVLGAIALLGFLCVTVVMMVATAVHSEGRGSR